MNRVKRSKVRVLPIVVLAGVALGLSALSLGGTPKTELELVWPSPPGAPRIRFLGTITTPQDLGIQQGWMARLKRAVKGGNSKRIVRPHGITTDLEGRLFVVDAFYGVVHVFDVEASKYHSFPEKPIEGFIHPIGVAVTAAGRVFVTDTEAGVVHVFKDRGKQYLKAIGHDDLERPTAIAVNPAKGSLLVVDTLAGRLVAFDLETLDKQRVIGTHGVEEAQFHYPTGIAIGGDGTVHVVDSLNFRVQVLTPDYEFLRAFGKAGDVPGHFSRPKGIAVDSDGNSYVVDALFDNVQIFDSEGRLLLAFGSSGQREGEFWLPNEIFVDDQDRVYVADSYNQRLQVFQYLREGSGR